MTQEPASEKLVDLDDTNRMFVFKDGHAEPYDNVMNVRADQRAIVANYESIKAIKDEIQQQIVSLEKHENAMAGVLDLEAVASAIIDVIAVLKNVASLP